MIFRKIFLVTLSFGTMLTVSAAPPEETGPRTVLFPLRHAVLSSQVESSIDRHHHQEGEAFQEGDVLIQFDDSAIRQHLLRSQASTREAEAGLEYARKNRETVADLFKKGLQGQQEMDRANLEVEVAEARLLGMQATQKLNEKELADCTIRAPFSGRVVRRLAQEHEFVRVGQQVLQILDDRTLLAALHVDSALRNRVKIGENRRIRIDETGTVHTGKITQISAEVDSGSRTFEIKISLDNADGRLAAGMSGVLLPEPAAGAPSATQPETQP